MGHYICFDETGKTLQQGVCMDGDEALQRPDAHTLVLVNKHFNLGHADVYYDGKIRRRPENPATLDGLTLSNVPVPSTLFIGASTYEITESTVDLEMPRGSYFLRLESFPAREKIFSLEVK